MRVLLPLALICLLVWPAAGVGSSAAGKRPTRPSPTYLYVSDAGGGTFTALKSQPGVYRLALTGVDPKVLYFSDRPYRLVGAEPLGRVLANFFHKPDKDPPNAAVNAIDARTGKTVVMGLELSQARYDWRKRTVIYTARRLHGGADHVLPAELARTSVFLDDYGYNTCSASFQTYTATAWTWSVTNAVRDNPNDTWWDGNPQFDPPWTGTPGYSVSWETQSGFDRGCSNSVFLENSAGTTVEIDTSDPYSGSNGYTCTVSDPRYNCTISQQSTLGGDNIDVYWVLTGP